MSTHSLVTEGRSARFGAVMTDERAALLSAVILFGWIMIVVLLILLEPRPGPVVPASAPATEFSAERAMQLVPALAPAPHWVGSPSNVQVRDQLMQDLTDLGLKPEVQRTTVYRKGSLADVENVVARLAGTANTKAILVDVHYDAMPTSVGASYAGAVAAMLETLRALKAGPPLRNDVIFLFTDAEEIGLHGAQGFWDDDPLAKEVGLVLGFTPRGDTGVSTLYGTGPDNAWAIQHYAQAAQYHAASSLASASGRFLPYDNDFTVFRTAGLPGLNFGFLENFVRYHALTDTPGNLDPRSIQYTGADSLPLIQQFGNADLSAPHPGDAVYFNTLGWWLLTYPAGWALPLAVITTLLVLGVIALGLRRRRLTAGIIWGWLAVPVMMIVAAVIAEAAWLAVGTGFRVPLIWSETYQGGWYDLAFISLSVASTAALYVLSRKRLRWTNLAVGALLWWLILALATAWLVPDGSYVFVLPLLASSLGLGLLFLIGDAVQAWWQRTLVLCLVALPALLLVSPLVHGSLIVQGASASAGAMVLVVLLLGLLFPQLEVLVTRRPWWLPLAAVVTGVVLIGIGLASYRGGSLQPRTDFVRYILNADTRRAIWFTTDDRSDAWLAQFFPNGITSGPVGDVLPYEQGSWGHAQAPAVALDAPRADVLEDRTANGVRSLRLRITSARHAPLMSIFVAPNVQVRSATVNGKQLDVSNLTPVNYYGFPSSGAELDLTVAAGQPVQLALVDQTQGLPQISGTAVQPRPPDLIPQPAGDLSFVSDTTLVAKSLSFAAAP